VNAGFLPWRAMMISYVVRLRSDALAEGCLVGEIEAVASRQRRSIASIDQIAAFVSETVQAQVRAAAGARCQAEDDPVTLDFPEAAALQDSRWAGGAGRAGGAGEPGEPGT